MDNKLKQNLRMLCLLMMTLIVQGVWAQVRTVTGTVSDGKDPLIGGQYRLKVMPKWEPSPTWTVNIPSK